MNMKSLTKEEKSVRKYLASLLVLGLFVAFFAVAMGIQPQADAKPDYGSNCASCHNGTVAPKLGGSTAPAPKPAPKPAPAKSTTTKPASNAAPAKTAKPAAPKEEPVKITVEGKAVKGFKLNGTVYASVKEYAAAMNYNLSWNGEKQIVTLSDYNTALEIYLLNGLIKYRGKDNKIASMTKDGASYVDIKGITELTHGKITEQNNVYTVRKSSKTFAWEQSGHNFDLKAAERMATNDACLKCHNGLANIDTTKKYADLNAQAPIGCNTCHGESKAVKDLRGAKPYVTPYGMEIDAGAGTVCINCHNINRPLNNFAGLYAEYRAPHQGPQAEVLFATGGFEFGERAYERSPHGAIEDTCVTCHMAKQDDEYGPVGGHTFKVASGDVQNLNACANCHADLKDLNRRALADYDGDKKLEGIQDEIHGLLEELKEAIKEKYQLVDLIDKSGRIMFVTDNSDTANPKGLEAGKVSENDYKAAFNYFLIEADGSEGIHNPAYAVQLLQQSYKAVTGHDVPNAVIR